MPDHSPTHGGAGIKTSSDSRADTNVRAYLLDPDASAKRVSQSSGRLFSREECRLGICIFSAQGQGKEESTYTRAQSVLRNITILTGNHDV